MIYLFNTNIVPDESVVRVQKITKDQAREIIAGVQTTSAIGHEATANAFSSILGKPVEVNRVNAQPVAGDTAISLKLNGRLQEGVLLDEQQMEEMGYTLYRIDFHPVSSVIAPQNYMGDGV